MLLAFALLYAVGCTLKPSYGKAVGSAPEHTLQVGNVQVKSRLMLPQIGYAAEMDKRGANGTVYFQVRIDKGEEPSFEKAQLLYLNFDMQKDFALLVQHDTLAASFCQRIENGRKGSYEYLVAFEEERLGQVNDYTLLYQDKIFGVGTVAFVHHP